MFAIAYHLFGAGGFLVMLRMMRLQMRLQVHVFLFLLAAGNVIIFTPAIKHYSRKLSKCGASSQLNDEVKQ